MNVNRNIPNLGPRVSVMSNKGETLVHLGDLHQGTGAGQFMAPHGLAVDSHGDIYVGEVSFTNMRNMGEEPPANMTTLRKLVRVDG